MPRYLGQHFLINKSATQKIVGVLNLQKGDTLIEIGPGEGALTISLAEKCAEVGCKIIAIEKDARLAEQMSNRQSQIEVIKGDALKLISSITQKLSGWSLVGNIPYYITGKLLRILGELEQKPKLIVLTIQKEVAERLAAKPPKMNLLAAATQIWCKPQILAYLKPKDFNPPPEVDSAIIKLEIEPKIQENSELLAYYRFIKILFKQPRKTVLNNLSTPLDKFRARSLNSKTEILEILKRVGLTGQERPQNLDLKTLIELSKSYSLLKLGS